MTKEETIMQAIGLLPEEMVIQKETEELKKGAALIEKKEKKIILLQKCRQVLACAACLALVIMSVYVYKGSNKTIQDMPVNNTKEIQNNNKNSKYPGTDGHTDIGGKGTANSKTGCQDTESKEKNKSQDISFYVMAKSYTDTDNSIDSFSENSQDKDTTNNINLKKTRPLTLVKLQTVKEQKVQEREKSTAKKTTTPEYIVFSLDKDFYFTVSNYKKGGKTYIENQKDGKKRFIKGKKELCRAGDKVYFDISVAGSVKKYTGIQTWDKKDIEITAFAKIYMPKDKSQEIAGIFYIGSKCKNNKEGKKYYGIFKSMDNN